MAPVLSTLMGIATLINSPASRLYPTFRPEAYVDPFTTLRSSADRTNLYSEPYAAFNTNITGKMDATVNQANLENVIIDLAGQINQLKRTVGQAPNISRNVMANRNVTPDGRLICNICQRPGHIARYCRNRQYDTRRNFPTSRFATGSNFIPSQRNFGGQLGLQGTHKYRSQEHVRFQEQQKSGPSIPLRNTRPFAANTQPTQSNGSN